MKWTPEMICGMTYEHIADLHNTDAEAWRLTTNDKPTTDEWTDWALNELVMDLRVETGHPQDIHRRFYNLLKPWFDKHNELAKRLDKYDNN